MSRSTISWPRRAVQPATDRARPAPRARKKSLSSPACPPTRAPFKPAPHGIIGGDFIFVTGQIAHGFNEAGMAPEAKLDPETWYGSPIKRQADVALTRCANVLTHVGASMADVVRADVYLNDIEDRLRARGGVEGTLPRGPASPHLCPDRSARCQVVHRRGECRRHQAWKRPEEGDDHCAQRSGSGSPPSPRNPRGGVAVRFRPLRHRLQGRACARGASPFGAPWFASSGKKQTAFILDCMEAICRAGGSSLKNVVWTQNFYSGPKMSVPRWRSGMSASRLSRPRPLSPASGGPSSAKDVPFISMPSQPSTELRQTA